MVPMQKDKGLFVNNNEECINELTDVDIDWKILYCCHSPHRNSFFQISIESQDKDR